jgi:hypothetical protein
MKYLELFERYKRTIGFRYSDPSDLVQIEIPGEYKNVKIIENSLLDYMKEEDIFNPSVKVTKTNISISYYAYSKDEIYYLNELIINFIYELQALDPKSQLEIRVNKRMLPAPSAA